MSGDSAEMIVSYRPYPPTVTPLNLRLLAGLCRLAQQPPRMPMAEIIRTAKNASRQTP